MSTSLLRSRNAVKIVRKTHNIPHVSSSSMVDGPIARAVSAGKHSVVPFQSFSAVALAEEGGGGSVKQDTNTPPSQPRTLPTRHSRHHAPPVALVNVLDEEHNRIVSSIPGTLIGKSWNILQSIYNYDSFFCTLHS